MSARLSKQHVSYLYIGVAIYLLELLIIWLAGKAGASNLVAVGLAFWIGLGVSFLLQKTHTFGDKRFGKKVLRFQLFAYGLLVLWNFGFTLVLTSVLGNVFPAVVCRTVALGITTVWNFYLYKTKIFKPAEQSKII